MSLNQNLLDQSSIFYNLEQLYNNQNLCYLQSLKETDGLSVKSHQSTEFTKDSQNTNFNKFCQFINFDKETYNTLRQEDIEQTKSNATNNVKAYQNSFNEFHARNSNHIISVLQNKLQDPFCINSEICDDQEKIKDIALKNWTFNTIKGSNPQKWPFDLKDFLSQIKEKEVQCFDTEPDEIHQEFFEKAKEMIQNELDTNKDKKIMVKNIMDALQAMLFVILHKANYTQIINLLDYITTVDEQLQNHQDIQQDIELGFQQLGNIINKYLQEVEKELNSEQYQKDNNLHYMPSFCNEGVFNIQHVAKFQRLGFQFNSMTVCDSYLYIYLASNQGGMFKIGTGKNNTNAGQVYLYRAVNQQEEQVSWVYIQKKLYLRTPQFDESTVEIINPQTFKSEGYIQLQCRELFSSQILNFLNNKFQLLTDGNYLYIIGKLIVTTKCDAQDQEAINQQNLEKLLLAPEQENNNEETTLKKKKLIKKTSQKEEPQQKITTDQNIERYNHILEYHLYKFDINQTGVQSSQENGQNEEQIKQNQDLTQELWESFGGFYSIEECVKALTISMDDIQKAAIWLADEGEAEREKRTILKKSRNLIAQAEIIGNNKDIKQQEFNTKEGSIITPTNVVNNCWTMNENNLALYCQTGIKLFSTNEEDLKELDQNTFINNKLENSGQNSVGKQYTALLAKLENDFIREQEERDITYDRYCDKSNQFQENIDILSSGDSADKKEKLDQFIKSQLQIEKDKERLESKSVQARQEYELKVKKLKEQCIQEEKKQNPQIKKKQLVLKSTYIKTVLKKKSFQTNPNNLICFSQEQQRFYILNYNPNYTSFPALVSYSKQQQHHYSQINIQNNITSLNENKFQIKNAQQLKIETIKQLNFFQKYRFQLPWKLNNMEYLYGLGLIEIQNQKQTIKREEAEGLNLNDTENPYSVLQNEKKKQLKTQKNTLIKRLNKVLEKNTEQQAQKKVLVNLQSALSELNLSSSILQNKIQIEIKKVYNYCVDGSFEQGFTIYKSVEPLLELLVQKKEESQITQQQRDELLILLNSLYYWTLHCDLLILYDQNNYNDQENSISLIHKIQKYIYQILQSYSEDSELCQILWQIIIKGFQIYAVTNQLQMQWFMLILQTPTLKNTEYNPLEQFCKKYEYSDLQKDDFAFKESIIEQYTSQREIVNQVDQNSNFQDIYKRNRQVSYSIENGSFNEPLGRILMDDLNCLNYQQKSFKASFESNNPSLFITDQIYLNQQILLNIQPLIQEEINQIKKQLSQKQEPEVKTKKKDTKQQDKSKEEKQEQEKKQDFQKTLEQIDKALKQETKSMLESNIKDHKIPSQNFQELLLQICSKSISCLLSNNDEELGFQTTYTYFWKLLRFLTEKTFEEIIKLKDAYYEFTQKTQLIEQIFALLDYTFEKLTQNKQKLINTTNQDQQNNINSYLLNLQSFVNFFSYIINQSSVSQGPSQQILTKFASIYSNLHSLTLFFKQNLNQQIISQSQNSSQMQQPGIHPTTYRTFQTSHPYEKGQQIFFDKIYWKNAIGIVIEQDPRNSSSQYDSLTITGWYGNNPSGQNSSLHSQGQIEGMYTMMKLNAHSQKHQNKKPLFILGNSLKVEFLSQPQVGQGNGEKISLWGYKIIARPVFGTNQYNVSSEVQNDQINLLNGFQKSEKLLLTTGLSYLQNFLSQNYKLSNQKQQNSKNILAEKNMQKWILFANGLIKTKPEDYIIQNNNSIKLFDISNEIQIENIKQIYYRITELCQGGGQFKKVQLGRESQVQFDSIQLQNQYEQSIKNEMLSGIYNYNLEYLNKKTEEQIQEKKDNKENQSEKDQNQNQLQNYFIDWGICSEGQLQHIQEYVYQIQNNEGKFVEFAQELKSQVTMPSIYRMEKMRPGFKKEFKDQWEKAEMLLILVQMYHNGLLQRELQESVNELIKEKITGIADTNRQVISYMILCIQDQKELQFCLESLYKKKWELEQKYIEKQMQDEIEQQKLELQRIEEEKQNQLKLEQQEKEKKEKDSNNNKEKQPQKEEKKDEVKSTAVQKVQQDVVRVGKKIVLVNKQPVIEQPEKKEDQKEEKTQKLSRCQLKKKKKKLQQKKEQNEEKQENNDENKQNQEKIEDILEKPKTLENPAYIQQVKEQLFEFFQKEICNGEEKIKQICVACQLQSIFNPDDLKNTVKQLFEQCQTILATKKYQEIEKTSEEKQTENQESQKQQKQVQQPIKFISPYFIVAKKIIEKCIFLLALQNNVENQCQQEEKDHNIQTEDEEDQQPSDQQSMEILPPLSMKRVISAPLSEKSLDQKKLQYFRQQMQSYQHFKYWEKRGQEEDFKQSEVYSPQQCLVSFLKLDININEIVQSYQNQNIECSKRIMALHLLNKLQENSIENQEEITGFIKNNYSTEVFQNILCCNNQLKEIYKDNLCQYLQTLITQFNHKFHTHLKNLTHQELIQKLSDQALSTQQISAIQQQQSQNSSSKPSQKKSNSNSSQNQTNDMNGDIYDQNQKVVYSFQDLLQDLYFQLTEIYTIINSKLLWDYPKFQQIFQNQNDEFIFNYIWGSTENSQAVNNQNSSQQQKSTLKKPRKGTFSLPTTTQNSFNNQNSGLELIKNAVQITLLCKNFLNISQELQDLKSLSISLSNQSQNLVYQLIDINTIPTLPHNLIKIQLYLLQKELGFLDINDCMYNPIDLLENSNQRLINARILARIFDLTGIQRIKLLQQNIYDILQYHNIDKIEKQTNQNCNLDEINQNNDKVVEKQQYKIFDNLATVLTTIIYHTNAPSVLQFTSRNIQILLKKVQINELPTPTQFNYQYIELDIIQLQKNKEILQNGQNFLEILQNNTKQYGLKLENQDNQNNLDILIEKIGIYILNKGENHLISLEDQIQKTVIQSREQTKSKYSIKFNNQQVLKQEYKEKQYALLVHLYEEEDITFLLKALFNWEKLYPTFSEKLPKNYKEYQEFVKQQELLNQKKIKETKERDQNKNKNTNSSSISAPIQNQQQQLLFCTNSIPERIMYNLPYISCNLENQQEKDLPLGWQLNYSGIFNDFQPQLNNNDIQVPEKMKVPAKKTWENKQLKALLQKYHYLKANLQNHFKNDNLETDEKTQQKFVQAFNFICQIYQHLKDISLVASLCNIHGFSPILEQKYSLEKVQQLAEILKYAGQNRINDIDPSQEIPEVGPKIHQVLDPQLLDQTTYIIKNETKSTDDKKKEINKEAEEKQIKEEQEKIKKLKEQHKQSLKNKPNSNMSLMIIEGNLYPLIENGKSQLIYQELIPKHENFYTEANSTPILHNLVRSGEGTNSMIIELIEIVNCILQNSEKSVQNFTQKLKKTLDLLVSKNQWSEFTEIQKIKIIGTLNALGGWNPSKIQSARVKLKSLVDEDDYIIAVGGEQSGQNKCGVYSKWDSSLTMQTMDIKEVEPVPLESYYLNKIEFSLYSELINALNQGVSNKQDSIDEQLILKSLLQITSKLPLATTFSNKNLNKDTIKQIITKLHNQVQTCPCDHRPTHYQNILVQEWQAYVNKNQAPSQQILIPNQDFYDNYSQEYNFVNYDIELPSLKKDPSKVQNLKENIVNYNISESNYSDSLPEIEEKVQKNYLLQHWQKKIFPAVEKYCKGNIQPWEIKMGIAQISNNIITGNIKKALEELFVVCDGKPPPDCDAQTIMAYSESTTLPIEEIKVGMCALANINSTNNAQSVIFSFLKGQQILQNYLVPVQVIAIDVRSSAILVLYQDHQNSQLFTFWLHVSQIKIPEIPLNFSQGAQRLKQIEEKLGKSLDISIKLLARNTLLQFFEIQNSQSLVNQQYNPISNNQLIKDSSLNLIELIKWSVLSELSNNSVKDWLLANGNIVNIKFLDQDKKSNEKVLINRNPDNKKTNSFGDMVMQLCSTIDGQNNLQVIEKLVEWCETEFQNTINYIIKKSYYADLKNCHKPKPKDEKDESMVNDNNDLIPINIYPEEEVENISQLILTFKSDTLLVKGSGLNLYQDSLGLKPVQGIHAGKSDNKNNFPPMVFNGKQLYTQYYFDQSNVQDKDERDRSKLECLVYLIPNNWSVLCWLIDTLGNGLVQNKSSNTSFKLLQKLNTILANNFEKMSGPSILKQYLAILLTRNTNKLQKYYSLLEQNNTPQKQFEVLGVQDSFITYLLEEINKIIDKQSEIPNALFSSALQDFSETAASLLCPVQQKGAQYNKNSQYTKNPQDFLPQNTKIPSGVKAIINIQVILNFIQNQNNGNSYLSRDLYFKVMDSLNFSSQWDRFILIQNIPKEWTIKEAKSVILEKIVSFRARIYNPDKDIFIFANPDKTEDKPDLPEHDGNAIILIESINTIGIEMDQKDEEEEKKENEEDDKEIEKEEEQEEEEEIEKVWACPMCTVHNQWDLSICGVCGSDAPPDKQPYVEPTQEVQVETVEIKKDEKEANLLEEEAVLDQERLQSIANKMQKYFNNYYKQKAKTQKNVLIEAIKEKHRKEDEEEEIKLKKIKEEEEQKKKEEELKKQEELKQKQLENKDNIQEENKEQEEKQQDIQKNSNTEEQPKEQQQQQEKQKLSKKQKKQLKQQQQLKKQQELEEMEKQRIILHKELEEKEKQEKINLKKQQKKNKKQKQDVKEEDKQPKEAQAPTRKKKIISQKKFSDQIHDQKKSSSKQNAEIQQNSKDLPLLQFMELSLQLTEDELKVQKELEEETRKIIEEKEKTQKIKAEKEQKQKKREEEINAIEVPEMTVTVCHGFDNVRDKAGIQVQEMLQNRILQDNQQELKNCVVQSIEQQMEDRENISAIEDIFDQQDMIPFEDREELVGALEQFVQIDAKSAWLILEKLGLDLWLNKSQTLNFKYKVNDISTLSKLLQFVEQNVCKMSKSTILFNPCYLRFNDLNSVLFKEDKNYQEVEPSNNYYSIIVEQKSLIQQAMEQFANLRFSWSLIRLLNENLQEGIHYINFQYCRNSEAIQINQNSSQIQLGIANYISEFRNLCLNQIKSDMTSNILTKTAKRRADDFGGTSVPKVLINRYKLAYSQIVQDNAATESPLVESKQNEIIQVPKKLGGQNSEFAFVKAYQQLKDIHRSVMRPATEPFIAFDVTLVGERAQGQYGLYRQFFTDISAELQPSKTNSNINKLGLLIPCENNLNNTGENQDKYIINPNAKSQHELQLFEFLGVIMGCCIRTGVTLALDLPNLFWKKIVEQKIVERDLEEIEKSFENLRRTILHGSKEEVEYYLNELGVSNSSQLNYDNRIDFLEELFYSRINATSLQVQFIQKGLYAMVPAPMIKILSHKDLEYKICGNKSIDLEMLKRHTEYKKPLKENSDLVKFFWGAVNQFSDQEKIKLIKFCWAQERLPASDEEFEKKQIKLGLKPSMYEASKINPDKCLPKADTCFFNLELPNYSSQAILYKQLLIAISFGSDIDNDTVPNQQNNSNGDDQNEW